MFLELYKSSVYPGELAAGQRSVSVPCESAQRQAKLPGVTKHLNINNCDANESGMLVKKKLLLLHYSESLVQLVFSF